MLFANYAPLACIEYNKPFRQAASQNHAIRWDSLRDDIFVWALTLPSHKQTHRRATGDDSPPQPFHENGQRGGNMLGRLGPLPPLFEQHVTRSSTGTELCRRYNLGKCSNPDCKFTHTCWIPGCNGSHPGKACTKCAA